MNGKTILILAASYYQLDAIRTARRLGYRVITTDNVPSNPGHALADVHYDADTTDGKAVLAIARRERIDGVIAAGTDVALPTAAFVAEKLGLVGSPLNSVNIVSSKVNFREFLRTNGIARPEAFPISRDSAPERELFEQGPWIIKPDRSGGSKGVFIVSSEQEFHRRLPETLRFSRTGVGICERFIRGFQGTCEGVLEDGRIAIACFLDRQTVDPPYVATCGHHVPSRLPDNIRARVLSRLDCIWKILHITDGPFDSDFVAAEDEVYILELSPRIGGNSIAVLLRKAFNFDIVEYGVRHVCGEKGIGPKTVEASPAALILLGVSAEGRLSYDATEAHALLQEPWVDSLVFDKAQGSSVSAFINGRCRIGEALIHGLDRDDLDARAVELKRRLRLRAI